MVSRHCLVLQGGAWGSPKAALLAEQGVCAEGAPPLPSTPPPFHTSSTVLSFFHLESFLGPLPVLASSGSSFNQQFLLVTTGRTTTPPRSSSCAALPPPLPPPGLPGPPPPHHCFHTGLGWTCHCYKNHASCNLSTAGAAPRSGTPTPTRTEVGTHEYSSRGPAATVLGRRRPWFS